MQFMLASLIGEQMAANIDSKVTVSKPWDHYPELFAKEKIEFEKEQREEELAGYKEKREAFARKINRERNRTQ